MNGSPDLTQHRPPKVLISILNWNGWRDTLECLESVRRLDYPNYLTVVVDSGSWDDSAERIKAWAHENLGAGHVLADYTQEIALQGGDPQTEEVLDRTGSPAPRSPRPCVSVSISFSSSLRPAGSRAPRLACSRAGTCCGAWRRWRASQQAWRFSVSQATCCSPMLASPCF